MTTRLQDAISIVAQKNVYDFRDTLTVELGDLVDQFLPNSRNRSLPPEVVLSGMMHQVLTPNGSLSKTLSKINADRISLGLEPLSNNTGALAKARAKLPSDFIAKLAKNQYTGMEKSKFPEYWLWKGLELKVIDGTTFSMSDTTENQLLYPHMKNDELGFPLARAVVLQSISTGLIQDANFGPFKGKQTGEMSLAAPLLSQLTEGDILLGDRYYPSFFVMTKLQKQLAHGLFQAHGARSIDFRQGKKLAEKDHIVKWARPQRPASMSIQEYNEYPEEIEVRETTVKVDKKEIILVSTLFDSRKFPAKELRKLYKKRWFVETALRDIKTFFGMEHITAKTPEMVAREFWIHILSYNYVRWYMANAAKHAETPVERISFQLTVATVVSNESNAINLKGEKLEHMQRVIMATLMTNLIPERPNRKEPRAIKKRPKKQERLKVPRKHWHEVITA